MKKLSTLINEAMDLHDQVREKLLNILQVAEDIEGGENIIAEVNKAATPFVNANAALEDILNVIEDIYQ